MKRRNFIKTTAAFSASIAMTSRAGSGNSNLNAPGMPTPKFVYSNGIDLAVYQSGKGLPVIFCHGFPELAFTWRKQLSAIEQAGYQAIAPDLRGYGLSSAPKSIKDYTVATICDDLVGMMDALNIEKAIFCGHDWGGFIADTMPLLYPERCLGIIGIGAHNNQRPPNLEWPKLAANDLLDKEAFNQHIQKTSTEAFLDLNSKALFQRIFQKDYLSASNLAKLNKDAPERSFNLVEMIKNKPKAPSYFVPQAAIDYYAKVFTKTGFASAINWYRAIPASVAEFSERKLHWGVQVPYLYIWPNQDPINQDGLEVGMEDYIADLEKVELKGCGHFVPEEQPEELNKLIISWLQRKFPVANS